jgi:hypothetical protein
LYSLFAELGKTPFLPKLFCAAFLAAVLTAWYDWLCVYLGSIPSLAVAIGLLLFGDLTSYGDNLAEVLGATYLVMVGMFWAYEKKYPRLGAVAFAAMLLKLLLNGYEYIFAALLMPFLPTVFYAVQGGSTRRRALRESAAIAKGIALACLVSFLILLAQVSWVASPAAAMRHFTDRVGLRMALDARQANIGMSRSEVLLWFFSSPCVGTGLFDVPLGAVILFFGLVSVAACYAYRRLRNRTLLALLATTWASVLCPVSFILLAKGHAARESHDSLVWHMPFTLFGLALTVATVKEHLGRPTPSSS